MLIEKKNIIKQWKSKTVEKLQKRNDFSPLSLALT